VPEIKVVVVDDDREDYLIVSDYLKKIDRGKFTTEWISNYETAVQVVKKQEADVYLVDYSLGAKSGIDLIDEVDVKSLLKPIILITGHSDRAIDLSAMEHGAADFLHKQKLTAELLERSIRYSIKQAQDKALLKEASCLAVEKKAAELASESKSRYVAEICHEIRNPLGVIMGFTDLAGDTETSESDRKLYLSKIQKSCEYLLELLSDSLDIAKVESGHIQVSLETLPLNDVVQDTIELMQETARQKKLVLKWHVDNGVPRLFSSDRRRLKQILLNLLSNAIKYTTAGSVQLDCRLERDLEGRSEVVFDVTDSGIGINSQEVEQLFKSFQRTEEVIRRKISGTGLGLNLSRRLAQALGGDLKLMFSQPGQGSTFSLRLPLPS
jgi:signal transduction histidine kinase